MSATSRTFVKFALPAVFAAGIFIFAPSAHAANPWDCSLASTTGYFALDGNAGNGCGSAAVTLTTSSMAYASATTTPWVSFLNNSAQTDHNNSMYTSDATGIETGHTLVFTFRYMGENGASSIIRNSDDNIIDAYAHNTIGQGFVFMMNTGGGSSQSTGTVSWYNGARDSNTTIYSVSDWINVIVENTGNGWDTWVHSVSSTEYNYVPYGGFNPNQTALRFYGYNVTNVEPHTWDEIIISNTSWTTSTRESYWANYWDAGSQGPPVPTVASTSQLRSDCVTSISEGGSTPENEMCFKAYLNSSSSLGLKLQIEISTSTSFTNALTGISTTTIPGSYATATIYAIPNGSYYWRARALDAYTDATSSWAQFGASGTVDFVVNLLSTSTAWDCSVSTTGYFPLDGNTSQPCGSGAVTLTSSPTLPYASATTTPWTSFLGQSSQTDHNNGFYTSDATGIETNHTLVFTFRYMGSNGANSIIRNSDDNIIDAYAHNTIGQGFVFMMNSGSGSKSTGTVSWYNGARDSNSTIYSVDDWINVMVENTGSGWDTWVHTVSSTEYNYVPYGNFNPNQTALRFYGYNSSNVEPHTWDEIIISDLTWTTSTRESYWSNYWDRSCAAIGCAGGTILSGNIIASTTWSPIFNPYIVSSTVTINSGVKITVEPGVIVKFKPETSLNVSGTLDVHGTTSSFVYFTSYFDDIGGDTNSDGAATIPSPGKWGQIYLASGASTTFNGAVIRYGGSSSTQSDAMIENNGVVYMNYSAITHSEGTGFFAFVDSTSSLYKVQVSNNYYGISVSGGFITVTTSTIFNNHLNSSAPTSTYGAYQTGGPTSTMTGNYWGGWMPLDYDPLTYNSGPFNASSNLQGVGNSVSPYIDYGAYTIAYLSKPNFPNWSPPAVNSSSFPYIMRIGNSTQYESALIAGKNTWMAQTPGYVTLDYSSNSPSYDWDLGIYDANDLALTWTGLFLSSPTSTPHIYFNAARMGSNPDVHQCVTTHELGHALGLAHGVIGSVMYTPCGESQTILSQQEIHDYNMLWGRNWLFNPHGYYWK